MDRHDRQARLAEVGSAGQTRIAAASIAVRASGLAAEMTTRYLAGAGVGRLRVGDRALADVATSVDPALRVEVDADASSPAPEDTSELRELRDPYAREAARGAREALRALRGVLEGAS